MAETYNPFINLAPVTPEGLSDYRQADFEGRTKGQSFWAQEAGRTGLQVRERLLQQGVALSREDERALNTKAIMEGAQKRLAELTKTGQLDPMDAQELVIQETMSGFMAAGDYNGAQSLLPHLNQIRTYKNEQAKLRSETTENLATATKDLSLSDQASARAANITARTPGQVAADEALARQRNADARLKDRTDPNSRKGAEASSRVGPAEQRDVRQAISGTLNLFNTMNDLIQMVEQAPWVTSKAAGVHTDVQQFLTGTNQYMQSMGKGREIWSLSALSDDPAQARNADGTPSTKSPREIVASNEVRMRAAANKLGVDVTVFRSAVINAAYALARANDPGGRLSNNDFDFALQMLGAVEDPSAARAAFSNLARQGYEKFRALSRSYDKETWAALFGEPTADVEDTYAKFTARNGQLGTPSSGPGRSTSGGSDKDGWVTLEDGTRIRKKPAK